jgi:hypothetical protein
MRQDPVELTIADKRRLVRRRRFSQRDQRGEVERRPSRPLSENAVDEAFADQTLQSIAAQVHALDRQCARLTELLRSMETAGAGR